MSGAANTGGLFRREALEHAGARAYGQVVLANTASSWLLAALFGTIATSIVAFLVFANFTRSTQVSGVLVPVGGLLRVIAPAAGVVADDPVRAGQTIANGSQLLSLRSQRGGAAAATTDEALATLLRARRDSLSGDLQQLTSQSAVRETAARHRLTELSDEAQQLQSQIDLQQRRVALSQLATQRYVELQARGFVADAQLQDRQSDWLDQQQRLAELTRARLAATRELAAARAEWQDLKLQALRDLEAARRNLTLLDEELTENAVRRELVLRATTAGTVAAITIERGQSVLAGQLLAVIVPAGSELEAELYAPSRAAGRLHAGMIVRLRYQGFPYQRYGQFAGRIREVAGTAVAADEMGAAAQALAGRSGEPLYRVRVRLENQAVTVNGLSVALKSGAQLDASIQLDRRRIIQWLFDPVLNVVKGA
jgi:membrane fusion protein